MKRLILAVVLFLLAFGIPVTVYSLVSRSNDQDIREKAAEKEEENTSAPRIYSIPVTEGIVGEKYSYKVKASDSDKDELTYYVKEKPDWLEWDQELMILEGIPTEENVGSYDVHISVSDGKWLDSQRFQISVEEEGTGDDIVEEGEETDESVSQVEETEVSDSDSEETSQSVEDISEYGLEPIAQDTSGESEEAVLGASTTTLPQTAVFGGVVVLSLGFGVVCVAGFLWADARWGIAGKFLMDRDYSKGKQISFKVKDGSTIKKRRVRV